MIVQLVLSSAGPIGRRLVLVARGCTLVLTRLAPAAFVAGQLERWSLVVGFVTAHCLFFLNKFF